MTDDRAMACAPAENVSAPRTHRVRRAAPAMLLIVAATVACVSRTWGLGLLGFDAYPLIISSRIQSIHDLAGTFTEKLMDGRYRDDFYRPLVNLSLALDYALCGTRPLGYQLDNAAWFAAALGATYVLARRLLGGNAVAGPLIGVIFLALHPLNFETIPVISRRPEIMCFVFAALAVRAAISPKALAKRVPIAPAAFTLLAAASKETALLFPGLIFIAVVAYSSRAGVIRRVAHGLIASVPHVIAAGFMLAARFAVIGGLGGHVHTSIADALPRYPATVEKLGALLWRPEPVLMSIWPAWSGGVALICIVGVAVVRWSGTSDQTTNMRARSLFAARAAVVSLAWLLLLALAYATGARIEPWYMFMPAAVASMLIAAAAETACGAAARGGVFRRALAAVGGTALLAVCIHQWSASPLIRGRDEWRVASDESRAFFEDLSRRIADAAPGTIVEAPAVPVWVPPNAARPTVFGAAIMADYSIQAWVELNFPGRKIRVKSSDGVIFPPKPGDIVVLLTGQKRGFERKELY